MLIKNQVEVKDFPKELFLILDIVSMKKTVHQAFADNIDWEKFVELSLHHRLYPVIYINLKSIDSSMVPEIVMEALRVHYHRNVFKMLHLSSEMEKINNALIQQNIQSIFLKGPVLAIKLYGDISLRTSKDLDILVSPKDVEQVEQILLKLGYKTDFEKVLNSWKRKNHHISYSHSANATQVELHWRMGSELTGAPFEELWNRRVTEVVSISPINYLGDEDLFIYLISHGAGHGWFRLRWLYDINQILNNKKINIGRLEELYEKYGGEDLTGQAITLASALFSSDIPYELQSRVCSNRSERLAANSLFFIKNKVDLSSLGEKSVLSYHKQYKHSLITGKQKLNLVIDYLYPSPLDVHLLPLPKALHFLYFPLRPFLWVWRRLRKDSIKNF